MFILIRAIAYATVFVGVLLVFVPAQILARVGFTRPATFGAAEWTGIVMVAVGAALAAWCVLAFVFLGKGTAAPFDPPRRLVVRGPYRFVRNPMYIGAGIALAGAALFYRSAWLWGYLAFLTLVIKLVVLFYEEPTLRRLFGQDYVEYCRAVRRWIPG